jgi:hypothetical protein
VLEGRAAMGYDHCYDAGMFYLGLDEKYVEGWPERIGEDDLDEEDFLRASAFSGKWASFKTCRPRLALRAPTG